MRDPAIIGLHGRAGCGKSEVARYLTRMHGFKVVKFADPLKDMLRAIGLTEDQIEGSLKDQSCKLLCGKSPRFAMITIGTEWGRDQIGGDIWTNIWNARVDSFFRYWIVADDVRFPNEAEAVRQRAGKIIQIVRDGTTTAHTKHESERHEIQGDYVIHNDGSLKDLYASVDLILHDIDMPFKPPPPMGEHAHRRL